MVTGPCNRNDCDRDRVPGSALVGYCAAHDLIDRARGTVEEGLAEHDPMALFGMEDGPGDLVKLADRHLAMTDGQVTDSLVFDFALCVIDDIVASDEYKNAAAQRSREDAWLW